MKSKKDNKLSLGNTNYLKFDDYKIFSLVKNAKNLDIVIQGVDKNNGLGRHLIDGKWKDNNFIWTIYPLKK